MEQVILADEWLFRYLQHWSGLNKWLDYIWVILGVWLIYFIPIILVAAWFWSAQTKRVAFKAGLAAIISWQVVSKAIAYFVPRERPSVSMVGAKELIFHRPDTSFPSDHMAAIFAIAFVFKIMGHRKLGNALLIVGAFIAIGRIMIGVHFPGDILAGILVGTLVALTVWKLRRPIDRFITEPFINLMKKVHL